MAMKQEKNELSIEQTSARSRVQGGWRVITLPSATDERGTLTYIETPESVPFVTRRIYYIHNVPAGASRGNHAHKFQQQLIVAVAGSFTVLVDQGNDILGKERLSHPQQGLLFGPMTWHSVVDFSPGAVCLVLGSADFCESDYIRDHGEFLAMSVRVPGGGQI